MGWAEMEALATAMTQARNEKKRKTKEKLEEIKKFNRAHPTSQTQAVVVYESTPQPNVDPITYNSAFFVLSYLTPPTRKRSSS